MLFRLICASLLLIGLGCGGSEGTPTTGPGQTGGGGAAGGSGSGGTGGTEPPAMQGGASLPMDVAQCEAGCLQARQCDLDACYSDVEGRLITSCTEACQGGNRAGFVALANGVCPDAGLQARDLLGITGECIGESSRCPANFCEDGSACADGGCADGTSCRQCPSDQACFNGACGIFSCVSDSADGSGNDGATAEALQSADNQVVGRTVCTGDEDWFAFNLPARQNLFVDVIFSHSVGDVDVEVYEAANLETRIASSVSASDNEQLVIPATNEPRDLLLKVFAFQEAQNEYDLHLNFDVPLAVCSSTAQCPAGQGCTNNACTPLPPCMSDEDCNFGSPICDVASGICYECLSNENCNGGVCSENSCLECLVDSDCAAGRCVESSCVECLADNDCPAGEICLGSSCGSMACRDSLEPNDTAETAIPINASMQYDNLYICGDEDYYSFSIPQGQAFIFNLTFIDEQGDIDVSITSGEDRVGSGTTTTDNEEVVFPSSTAGGDYVAKVRRFGATSGSCSEGFCSSDPQIPCETNEQCPAPPSEQIYGMFIDTNPPAGICNTTEDCLGAEECDRASNRCRPEGFCSRNTDCADEVMGSSQCDVQSNMCVPCQPSEAPSTLESPNMVDVAGYRGSHNTCGGPDFYGFNMAPNQLLRVEVSFAHAEGDIDIKLIDPMGMTATSSAGTMDLETLEYTSPAGGFYVLEVYGFRGVFNQYQLQMTAQ